MGKQRPVGPCHLCGDVKELSFEHVPSAAAFNRRPVVEEPLFEVMRRGLDSPARGRINQRGAGSYTLCEDCNNKTGSWYADDFAVWCAQGAKVLRLSGFRPKLIYLHYVFPLRVLKQIYVMAFSTNRESWRKKHPELEQFVLDRSRRWLNPRYRSFVYYNVEGGLRRVGNAMAVVDLNRGPGVLQVTEIARPPFGYVVTTDGSRPNDLLCEITHFHRYEYDEMEVAPLYLPVLPTHLPIPLDYRTSGEIDGQAKRGEAREIADRALDIARKS